jgi:tRNA-splicing ligase RtcB
MAVMPDVDPSADVCVGTVLATGGLVYPKAVGGDIGCGMATVACKPAPLDALHDKRRRRVLEEFTARIAILRRRHADSGWSSHAPDPTSLSDERLAKGAARDGLIQFGTLGRGNHFLEVQADEEDRVWIMVHSGSRAMGQYIVDHHTRRAATALGRSSQRALGGRLLAVDASSPEGTAYLHDHDWCVRYAAANRRRLLEDAAAVLKRECGLSIDWSSLIDVPHNFVRRESHGEYLIVHRKGAAPADAGSIGVIPGSAGTFSVHVEGLGNADALRSSSHGSGRVLSRAEAKRGVSSSKLRRQLDGVTHDERLMARLTDEAPSVYRDLRLVLEAQRDLVRTRRKLRPLMSYKGG